MKILSILFLVSIAINCVAQDVHFSQFKISSFLLNPALVGSQNSDYKATLQRKSQWESVISIGIANLHEINKKMAVESGIAFYHINKPRQSLIANDAITLNQKMHLHTTLNYAFNAKLGMQPKLLLSNQDTDKEFLLAFDVNYLLEAEQNVILKLGIAERFNDATIFYFGAEIESLSCVVNYDVNTSNLANASNNKGGFEFSVVYQWKVLKKEKSIKQEQCPKYL